VGSGIAIMEMIYKARADYGLTINTVVTGFAYSMGAIVFQAGDQRLMGAYSTLMLHSPSWFLSGSDQRIFNDYAVLADHYKNLVANLFAGRTGRHDPTWWQEFIYSGRDRFLSAAECLELGLADGLYDQLTRPRPCRARGSRRPPPPTSRPCRFFTTETQRVQGYLTGTMWISKKPRLRRRVSGPPGARAASGVARRSSLVPAGTSNRGVCQVARSPAGTEAV
jgi:hypothetical protein